MFGEASAEVAAASGELIGARAGRPVERMLATAVTAARHRQGVLPRAHVGAQLGRCVGELGLEQFASVHLPG